MMPDEDGLRVVLTPPQLAAVLANGTLEQPSFAARGWGAARAIFGAVEVLGGGALLAVPEPTMVTKVGGGALAVHGIDSFQAGVRQAISGLDTDSVTSDATSALAERLGIDRAAAERIGDGVDILVPIAVSGGLAAVRVVAVRGGRISLAAHEAAAGSRAGGHTILKHVGRTEAQLRARLLQEPRIPAASTFRTIAEAERAVGGALRANSARIVAWAHAAAPNARLRLVWPAGRVVGHGVVRLTGQYGPMRNVLVVLKKETYNGKLYYVLTSFPMP